MTFGEYSAYAMGLNRRRAERWEQVRKLAFVQARSMGGLEVSETEFMPLPYDQSQEKPEINYLDDDFLNEVL